MDGPYTPEITPRYMYTDQDLELYKEYPELYDQKELIEKAVSAKHESYQWFFLTISITDRDSVPPPSPAYRIAS